MASPFAQLRSYQRNLRYQGYQSVPVEQFGGLNLVSDPSEVGWGAAVDCLNVDFDHLGQVRARDGFTTWASATSPINMLVHRRTSSTRQVIVAANADRFIAYDNTGAVVATQLTAGAFAAASGYGGLANFGTPSNEYVYAADGTDTLYRWDGAAWSGPVANTPKATLLAVQTPSNRLVASGFYGTTGGPTGGAGTSSPSHVYFSDEEAAETWTTNNFVELTPGDGERISSLIAWRDLIFVFKQSKFFVFYGNSIDGTGNPKFNYRRIDIDGEMAGLPGVVCRAPEGVYFLTGQGVYLTTGGPPQKVSGAIDSFFTRKTNSYFAGGTFSQDSTAAGQSMVFFQGRLYVSLLVSGGGRVLVYDPPRGIWTIYSLAGGSSDGSDAPSGMVAFVDSNSTQVLLASMRSSVVKFSSSATTDAGTAITSRYRAGYFNVPGRSRADGRQVIRQWKLKGTGTVNFGVAADDATSIPTTGGGAQASVALAGPYPNFRTSQLGYDFSWQVSGTGSWSLASVEADVA